MLFDSENWIVRERTRLGLSQFKLAEILGISNSKLCSWENQRLQPSEKEKKLIAKKLKALEKSLETGTFSVKKRYQGRAKIFQTKTLGASDWKNIKIDYPESYLKRIAHSSDASHSNGFTAISLFAGCGGMSLGFKRAGFNLVGFVEIEKSARSIYKLNFPDAVELGQDILDFSDDDIRGWKKTFGTVDVICGGPPCQGISLAGKRDSNDYRNSLYKEYLRIADIIRPKIILMENVRVLTSMREKDGALVIDNIIAGFSAIGYKVTWQVLNAADYGVPQARERVLIVGVDRNLGISPTLPAATHCEDGGRKTKWLTFRDACRDLTELEAAQSCAKDPLHWTISHPKHVIEWLKLTPEGKSAHENADPAMRPPSGYNTTYKRLRWDEPSSTISTNFNMISGSRNVHPESTRSLTIREAMRCQSFPDDFKVIGAWGDIRTAIGNAVPPILAQRMAEHIGNILKSEPR